MREGMAKFDVIEITGPADWASYFINGDASGLSDEEKVQADAWLKRQGNIEIIGVACDDSGEAVEPRFTWLFDHYAPECGCIGGNVIDYVAIIREAAH